MSTSTADSVSGRPQGRFLDGLLHRQIDSYPDTGPRLAFLALTVLATATLYYELYVSASVATQQLTDLHMSFTYYVTILAIVNLIGAFGSLLAGLGDRLGRVNMVVAGLLIVGILVAFVMPACHSKLPFGIAYCVVGLVEGICLVATPALIRDFSPQVGRATAMGFWTMGPVLGSLIVAVIATNTLPKWVNGNESLAHLRQFHSVWAHQYHIAGIVGLAVFAVCFLFLRELSPGLRDQLMVSTRDRALIEAKAKGLDIDDALKRPFRQMLHADVLVAAVGVAVFLLIYYTAVGFATVYFETVFGFSASQANGLGNWNWAFNLIFLIAIGLLSDRLRVRKPFMIVGGIGAAVMIVVYLSLATHSHVGYYELALILAGTAAFLGIAYTPWMAGFTETVEARNPALTATGLAVWGWIIRIIIFASYMVFPHMVHATNALVDKGGTVKAYAAQYPALVNYGAKIDPATSAALSANPDNQTAQVKALSELSGVPEASVATVAQASVQYAGPIATLQAIDSKTAGQLLTGSTAAQATAVGEIVSKLHVTPAVAVQRLQAVSQVPQSDLLALGQYGQKVQTAVTHLKEVGAVPKSVATYMGKNAASVQKAQKDSPHQWQNWYWVCFGGVIFFLLAVPLMRGRWSPSKAKADFDAHEKLVAEEMAKLHV